MARPASPWHYLREGTGLGEKCEEDIRQARCFNRGAWMRKQIYSQMLRVARRDRLTSNKLAEVTGD